MELKPGYEQTEVEGIPEDWAVESIGSLGKWLSGGTPSMSNDEYWVGDIPWVSPKDMKVAKLHDALDHVSEKALSNGTRLAPLHSVLMVVRGMILAHSLPIARAERPVAFNQDIKALVTKPGVDSEFILWWMQSHRGELLSITTESTHGTKRMPSEALFSGKISLPPAEEQRVIATALSDVDALISSLDQLIAKKRDIKQATMQQLLTGKQRLPGFGDLQLGYRQTEIGMIPEDWNISKVGALGQVVTGGTPSTARREYWNGSYPWITPTDMLGSRVLYMSERLLTRDGLQAVRILPPDSVLVTCIASIGKVAILKSQGACNQQINAIIPNGNHDPIFLYYVFSTAKQYLLANAGVTATPIISKKTFENLWVVTPELHEQKAIASVLSDMDAEISALEQRRDKTRALKQGMMQELFTGRIRLV